MRSLHLTRAGPPTRAHPGAATSTLHPLARALPRPGRLGVLAPPTLREACSPREPRGATVPCATPSKQSHAPASATNPTPPDAGKAPKPGSANWGDTAGATAVLRDVTVAVGSNELLSDVEWSVMAGDRWALVGPNGAGKSTLVKAIIGLEGVLVPFGSVTLKHGLRLGYLEQTAVGGSTRTVREEAASRMDRLMAAKERMDRATMEVENGNSTEAALEELSASMEAFEAAGGYNADEKVSKVLKGLGFSEEAMDGACSELSLGWQMRVALARLLLSEPELLIMDEPSNHLDAASRKWLATYLSEYDGTVLLVSHDVELLRGAATSIAEVRAGTLETYRSRPYDKWVVEREERMAQQQAEYEKTQAEIERLQGFVDRFGAKATKASQAASRQKMIERLEKSSPDAPVGTLRTRAPKLDLPKPPPCNKEMLFLDDASFGWDAEGDPVVSGANLKVTRGDRVVVRGPNGAGKSTLLAAVSGRLPLASGKRRKGEGVSLGYFTQDLAQDLDQSAVAVELVLAEARQHDPLITQERARSVMGALGLSADKALRTVGMLSGGEKARVVLAMFALVPRNILLLDEPTNHLDVQTIETLVQSLKDYPGALMVVSHDKPFCMALGASHVATVQEGKLTVEQRDLRDSDFEIASLEHSVAQSTNGAPSSNGSKARAPAAKGPAPPQEMTKEERRAAEKRRKLKLDAPKLVGKVEGKIEAAEEEMAELEAASIEAGSDVAKLAKLEDDRAKLQGKLDDLYAQYEELLEVLEEA
ncbi:unnamed protein product [Pedinophyceae sp. YPF-701]|nr:unnamed protein product [Pedinophyceae sp. YPF-701]